MSDRPKIAIFFKPSGSGLEKFFGKLEAEVMEIVWENNPITIKRVIHFLNKKHAYAYTTIMTIMNRLVKKNVLHREKKGHSFIYLPQIGKQEFLEKSAEEIITSLMADYLDITVNTITRARKSKKK